MSTTIISHNDHFPKIDEEEASKRAIENYKKAWRIKDSKTIHMDSSLDGNISKRNVGDVWFDGEKWCEQREQYVYKSTRQPNFYSEIAKKESVFVSCKKCEKKVIDNIHNTNEIEIIKNTGKCFHCHAIDEMNIKLGGTKITTNDFDENPIIKDSFGRDLMRLSDIKEHYGEDVYIKAKEAYENFIEGRKKPKNEEQNIDISHHE